MHLIHGGWPNHNWPIFATKVDSPFFFNVIEVRSRRGHNHWNLHNGQPHKIRIMVLLTVVNKGECHVCVLCYGISTLTQSEKKVYCTDGRYVMRRCKH